MKFGGHSVKRIEDDRLLTGQGRYTDDVQLPDMAYGVTLRSPYGHARVASIDTAAAKAMPGVLAIYTAADVAGYGGIPCIVPLSKVQTPHPLLTDVARFVGNGIAFVVADSREAARAAAEAIEVDFDELPAITTIDEAIADGAAEIWPGGNDIFLWEKGDAAAAQAAIDGAAHVTRLRVVQNRVAPTSMEVRAAVGSWDAEGGYTLHAGSQGVAGMRDQLAKHILNVPAEQIRVITGDVGGGFGMKSFVYPEYALVLIAARDLGRPVKWTGDRSDAFQTDTHGRAMVSDAVLALDAKGMITALKVETWSDLGAYQSTFGPAIQTMAGGTIIGGVYRIPAIHNAVHGVITNTAPVDAYRGAGRPESAYIMERLIEAAARQAGLSVDEIRRRNLLRPDELPHANGLGLTFDVGNYPAVLEKAVRQSDWAGFAARKSDAVRRSQRYGRGLCYYVEIAGGGGTQEFADIRVAADGIVEAAVGTQSNGQGHETAYAQVLADQLGIDIDRVRIVQGDTERLDQGHGTGGSRSLVWGGGAIIVAADEMIERGKALAAGDLDAAEIDYAEGLFSARGTNRTISLHELAAKHPQALDGRAKYSIPAPKPAWPNGCHIAEVEVDPATGMVKVARYSLVDDFGTIMNPMLVEGQVHGGIAQGLGQALIENIVYGDGAQLLTGSFMDYGIPRADDMPRVEFDTLGTPNPNNPLGAKGCGEAGTIGAMPSIINAIIDALDGTQLEMPATPEKVWRLCRELEASRAA
ncbi:xanthine dehydrogenase family protein molybdopterin-binding subunit [Sphingoaurantiacus capsulatus]|uniref:Xanthine dehydrogenase family protein molybdopterin-binding subunit n=1 Tax=Sphingoaurantiacus capsulatus TaxID=1771310 RepID=A0ABV7X9L8_9SPHN